MATMKSSELLADAFGRIEETVARVLNATDAERLNWRPGGTGNSIAWLLWHLTRIQDDHMAELAGVEQRWTADGFAERFGFPLDPADTGYAHSSAQVDAVRVDSGGLLLDYHRAVQRQSAELLKGLDGADFDRIVDRRWTPAVTLGVRVVSVVNDCLQHAGQAAYVRGLPMDVLRPN
jgi:uncharacterized damage-inducible protein DinB